MVIRKPDVIVAGFPKCGTTTLFNILKQHPEIYIPKNKEVNYWGKYYYYQHMPIIKNPNYQKSKSWYYNHFRSNKKCIIDFEQISSYDLSSAKRIKKELGEIKIIFITRDREPHQNSYYRHLLDEGCFDDITYKEYNLYFGFLSYLSDFDKYINPFKQLFKNVLVLNLESLSKKPKEEITKIINFLELEDYEFNYDIDINSGKNKQFNSKRRLTRVVSEIVAILNLKGIIYLIIKKLRSLIF